MPAVRIASARIVCRIWLRCVTYLCASVLLHFAHMPLRFVGSCPPPASSGMMWSTWVLGIRLQTVHTGCSRRTTPLFLRYSGFECCLLILR